MWPMGTPETGQLPPLTRPEGWRDYASRQRHRKASAHSSRSERLVGGRTDRFAAIAHEVAISRLDRRRWAAAAKTPAAAPGSEMGRASMPNPCPNPLAILEAGVRGLSTWVSPLSKATPLPRFPHGLSAWWMSPRYPSFVIYYRPFFVGPFPRVSI